MNATILGPREIEVLALLCTSAPITRREVEETLHFQGGSSTLIRLETKGYARRDKALFFFDGDDWWPTERGRATILAELLGTERPV